MSLVIKTYPSEEAARRAVEALRAAGVPPGTSRLLTGQPLRDLRREPRGGFAGPVGPDAAVGSFASVARRRGQASGSFATDNPDRRKGSFADVDRVVMATYGHDAERRRLMSHRRLRRLLRRAGLDEGAADRARDELQTGQAVVLVDVAGITPSDARGRLEHVAQAA